MYCCKPAARTDRHGMTRIACASVSTINKDANDESMSVDSTAKGRKKGNVLAAFLGGLKLSAMITSLAFLWKVSRWSLGYHEAVVAAFTEIDLDGDGWVDSKELYSGVLLIYLRLKGLMRLKVPKQESVMRLMEMMDADNSGDLDFDEFQRTMDMLSGQLLIRGLVQLVLVFLCPLLAFTLIHAVASAIQHNQSNIKEASSKCHAILQARTVGRFFLTVVTPLATKVKRICQKLPATLPATLLTVIMLNVIGKWLYVIDDYLICWVS